MKKERNFFSGIKSMCFMLFACLILSICATSCSSDEFETNLPEEQRQYTKAELIEQALSRMPQTRIEGSGVMMITIKDTVNIKVRATEAMEITWGDDQSVPDIITAGEEYNRSYIYTDGKLSHAIYLLGSAKAIQSLNIDNNGLILLDVFSNENLENLSCTNNYLDELDLTKCSALKYLYITNNEISSLEISHLSSLFHLYAENNRLTALDASNNPDLFVLFLKNNRIKNLDVSNNPDLATLDVKNNLIDNLNVSNSSNMVSLYVAFNPITDIDLSKNVYLMDIDMEGVPLKTLNNNPISDTSFSMFSILYSLNVASTSFDSLDLSKNPMLSYVNISESEIVKLNISNIRIQKLNATRSKLTDLKCTIDDLTKLNELRIENTPFEKVEDNIRELPSVLPGRKGVSPGHLYTYSRHIHYLNDLPIAKNWLINQ